MNYVNQFLMMGAKSAEQMRKNLEVLEKESLSGKELDRVQFIKIEGPLAGVEQERRNRYGYRSAVL